MNCVWPCALWPWNDQSGLSTYYDRCGPSRNCRRRCCSRWICTIPHYRPTQSCVTCMLPSRRRRALVCGMCVCASSVPRLSFVAQLAREPLFHATYSIYSVLKIPGSIACIHSCYISSLFLLRIELFLKSALVQVLYYAGFAFGPGSRRPNANSERKACQPRERLREEAQSVLRGCTRTGGRHGLQCLAIALRAQHKPTQGAQETQSPGERFERR